VRTEKSTLILSADTSSSRFSIALSRGVMLIDEFETGAPDRHSSDLLPAIDKLLSKNSCGIEDVGALCIGLGPGSFTGLRVGITTMRALAISLKRPIAGISSIDAIAHNASGHNSTICLVIDARQNKVYARLYRCNGKVITPKSKILLLGIKDLLKKNKARGPVLFLGDGLKQHKEDILKQEGLNAEFAPEPLWYPKAAVIGRLGYDRLKRGGRDNAFTLSPLYIYPKECQVKKTQNSKLKTQK
jgi:tRNA threonylcarbamoyladenosine biosynthesis protein TsaB